MAERLRYGSAPESDILAELEDLREKRDVDGMITRALAADSNILILNEVLTSIHEGRFPGNAQGSPTSRRAYAYS